MVDAAPTDAERRIIMDEYIERETIKAEMIHYRKTSARTERRC